MTGTDPITRELARGACKLEFADIPAEAREVARHGLLDTLGCAVAGATEELVDVLVDELVRSEGSGAARLLGRIECASARTAALVNGAAAHALDYDDTHMRMSGHPSVPVLPALLALAESQTLTGAELVTAYIAGVETEARAGALMNPRHYSAGFHATGTLGTLGAAAACARALALDEERASHALALAATQAAGLKASFGTIFTPGSPRKRGSPQRCSPAAGSPATPRFSNHLRVSPQPIKGKVTASKRSVVSRTSS
jgi:2-methylcitrate dehydratase PrpD